LAPPLCGALEELVKQHGVHSFIAHAVDVPIGIASYQIGVHLFHLVGHQSELRDAVAVDGDSSKKRVPARTFARLRHESSYNTTSCELSLPDGNFASAVAGPAHLECVLPVQDEHVH